MQTTTFRNKQRDQLGDTVQGSQSFTDQQLDGWRDDELGLLYARGLFTKDTNYGTEIVISGTPTPLYYAMPANFRRIDRVEFVSTTDLTEIEGNSFGFDDLERPGYIRIPEATNYNGYGIRVFGQKEYTSVTDTAIHQEVLDVVLYGSCLRALMGEYAKRIETRRSLSTTRRADTTPSDIVTGLNMMERHLQKAVAKALAVQSRSIQGA